MPVAIDIRHNLGLADRFLRTTARQIPFATAKAINDTLKQAQEAVRHGIEQRFTLRRPQWVLRTVKINRGDFATKRKLEGKLQIDPNRDVLAKFERGGIKRPQEGRHLAVPIEAKRTGSGVVSRAQLPKKLEFRQLPGGQIVGRKKTFLVRGVGIFQRYGRRAASKVRMLFAFVRQVPIPPDLRFVETARAVVRRRFDDNFRKAWDFALRTARR